MITSNYRYGLGLTPPPQTGAFHRYYSKKRVIEQSAQLRKPAGGRLPFSHEQATYRSFTAAGPFVKRSGMNGAGSADGGLNRPSGGANSAPVPAHSGQSNPNTPSVSSRSGGRVGPRQKGLGDARPSFYRQLQGLPREKQILFLLYGKEGPGTPAQQLAAQIRSLNNALAWFPYLESSPTTASIRDGIEKKMQLLSPQEQALVRNGQMKGSPKLPKPTDQIIAARLMLFVEKAGPVNLSRFQRDLKRLKFENGKRISLDLRTIRQLARVLRISVPTAGRPPKQAVGQGGS